jgi:hypothetical protein
LAVLPNLFSQSSSFFRFSGMSRLCNLIQSSVRGTGYVFNQLLFWRRCVVWMMNGSRHYGGMANTSRYTRQIRCHGGDAGGVINIPVLFVWFFLNFKRQIQVRHLSIHFLVIEFTSFRSHQLTALSASQIIT